MVKDERLKADAVKTLLKYIYSDFMDVADINNDSVWDVIYAGFWNFSNKGKCGENAYFRFSERNLKIFRLVFPSNL